MNDVRDEIKGYTGPTAQPLCSSNCVNISEKEDSDKVIKPWCKRYDKFLDHGSYAPNFMKLIECDL